ncbi:MAG TPA: carboxypeptidase regulatory-like domain-containing protein [Candidatus Sulfopaludibacter sp.]|nr:carboxypeptidase regulatory-like domain-containing protein [Candidatus Sulfopaludibacter sp.]
MKGALTDDSGAVIPAATVSITGNGATKTAQTQADGSYTFTGLRPGSYSIAVNVPGFQAAAKTVAVTAGGTVQAPIQLAVAAEKQEVTVAAEGSATVSVEPDNNATALTIRGEDLQALPDDPDDLSDALAALAGPGAGPNGGQLYIDGFTGGQLPPKESIREIRINQNPFSAEFDRLGFGRIEILTKPGTDKFHGMVFFNDSDAEFDSRNPFASNKPDYSNRQYGGNFGGPLNHRASFFLDYNERDITNNAITHAIYFDPLALTTIPINTSLVTPMTNRTISPRIDYQLTTNNTLTARFEERLNNFENSGLGGYRLPPPYANLAYNSQSNAQNLMLTETAVLTPKVVNETRFQYTRNSSQSTGNELPQINVANSFVTGGNGIGNTYDKAHHYELQNYTSLSQGVHTVRFGVRIRRESDQSNNPAGFNGTFSFLGGVEPQLDAANQIVYDAAGNPVTQVLTSLQQYQRNVLLSQAGLSQTQIQALGGGPSRFSIQGGSSYISMTRWDFGPFIQDDWRIHPNFTLSLGLRYEVQTLLSDYRDWAPRVGFAWAPGSSKNGRQKTVIRGGAGIFYDRIGLGTFEQAALNNGFTQLQYTVYNPVFYPNIPSLSTLNAGQNAIYRIDPNLRASYSLQSAIGVERQLPRNTTVSATYTNNRGEHMMQTVPINTPLPGSFNPLAPLGPSNGIFPYGYGAGNIFEYESGSVLRQSIFMVTMNTRFSPKVSLYANYQLTYANDLPGTPTNPYNFALDYGRSNLDRRNNFQVFGSVVAPLAIHLAPFITLRSGGPYDVLVGEDLFGSTLTNARAAFAPQGACPPGFRGVIGDVVCSSAGNFTGAYNVANGSNVVPRNYLTMAGLISVNLRLYRTFGFGPVAGGRGAGGPGGGGPGGGGGGGHDRGGGGGMRMGPGGGGGRGGDVTEHRFNLMLGVNVTNILNHFNPGGYQGVITSPQFLEPTTVNTGFGGGGFGGFGGAAAANNRRVEFDARFTF